MVFNFNVRSNQTDNIFCNEWLYFEIFRIFVELCNSLNCDLDWLDIDLLMILKCLPVISMVILYMEERMLNITKSRANSRVTHSSWAMFSLSHFDVVYFLLKITYQI